MQILDTHTDVNAARQSPQAKPKAHFLVLVSHAVLHASDVACCLLKHNCIQALRNVITITGIHTVRMRKLSNWSSWQTENLSNSIT